MANNNQDQPNDNPLKDENMNKGKRQNRSDRAQPEDTRTPTRETQTGQGGSNKGGREDRAHSNHPDEHGGVKYEMDDERERGEARFNERDEID